MYRKNIVRLRKINKISQKEIAKKIGVTAQVISNWERGYSIPTAIDIVKIADFFGVTTDEILR